jgi:DNA-binding CsgD family transcriptional regulator
MEPFDLAQSFIEQLIRDNRAPALRAAFEDALTRLGFRYFACCSHVNPLQPPPGTIHLHNYPRAWEREYYERRLYEIDPVPMYAERTLLPFHWNSVDFQASMTESQRQLLLEAAQHGVAHGYTVPIHLPWRLGAARASCSVVPDSPAIDARTYWAVELMASRLYVAATTQADSMVMTTPASELSERERQCLELVAQGKSNWAIGQILKISEHTVHTYIEHAKKRLGVATRVQAILYALQGGQLSFGDVIRANHQKERAQQ